MREAGSVVVAGRFDEDLGLVFQAAKRLGMQNSIPVSLKGRSNAVRLLFDRPSFAFGGFCRVRREEFELSLLNGFANVFRHNLGTFGNGRP